MQMRKLTYTAMWLAVGVALAYLFHLVNLGRMFLPLHLVAMLAGATSGAFVGGVTGAVLPILSFLTMGMPPFPMFLFMIPEVFTYGFVMGVMKKTYSLESSSLWFLEDSFTRFLTTFLGLSLVSSFSR